LKLLKTGEAIRSLGAREAARQAKALAREIQGVRDIAPTSTWADDYAGARPSDRWADYPPRGAPMVMCRCCRREYGQATNYVNVHGTCMDCHLEGREPGKLNAGKESKLTGSMGSVVSEKTLRNGVKDRDISG